MSTDKSTISVAFNVSQRKAKYSSVLYLFIAITSKLGKIMGEIMGEIVMEIVMEREGRERRYIGSSIQCWPKGSKAL